MYSDLEEELDRYIRLDAKRMRRLCQMVARRLIAEYRRRKAARDAFELKMRGKLEAEAMRKAHAMAEHVMHQREYELQELRKQQKLKMEEMARNKCWTCDRPECDHRVFHNQRRFQAHVQVHIDEDRKEWEEEAIRGEAKKVRQVKEANFINGLRKKRREANAAAERRAKAVEAVKKEEAEAAKVSLG